MSIHELSRSERKKLGSVMHLSQSTGNLILKVSNDVNIGESVFDTNGRRVGSVFDFFGPVSAPMVAVKPIIEDPSKIVGSDLWLIDRIRERRRDKKKRN